MGNNVIKDWKRRWVLMKSDKIEYYRNKFDSIPAGTISLVSSHVKESSIRSHCMEIITPTRSYWFTGENDGERDEWIIAISLTTRRLMDHVLSGKKSLPSPVRFITKLFIKTNYSKYF